MTATGSIFFKDKSIIGLKIEDKAYSWEDSDNTFAASFTFTDGSTDKHFWPSIVWGNCFTGWLQWPGKERLDFRGSWALENWAGSYFTQVRWGGAKGAWHPSPNLYVSQTGEVMYGETVIKNTSFRRATTIEWTIDGGNAQNTSIAFSFGCTNKLYFDPPQPTSVGCFIGTRQSPREGPIGFRGAATTLDN